jgi:hypothetical protein
MSAVNIADVAGTLAAVIITTLALDAAKVQILARPARHGPAGRSPVDVGHDVTVRGAQ